MKSKRESIFLIGVAVAVVVFFFDRIAPSLKANNKEAHERLDATKSFVKEKEQIIEIYALQRHQITVLNMLLDECPPNPFARKWVEIIADQKRINRLSIIEPVLTYNGFLRAGDRYIAIVNGEDYEVGNKIEHVPLKIRTITSDRIDVENPDSKSNARLSVKILPLEHEDE